MLEIVTHCADETIETGKKLGCILKKGDIVCLSGCLGAGKTAFTGGIAKALDVQDHISSPTFTIVNEYPGRVPLYHFDMYRLDSPDEVYDIGFEEYMYGDGVVVIEWAEKVKDLLPEEYIWVDIKTTAEGSENSRTISIEFHGERYGVYEDGRWLSENTCS